MIEDYETAPLRPIPAVPYHVEPRTENYRHTFAVYPNPAVLTGCRLPVARHITTWEVATQFALAPEMEGVLRKTREMIERCRWHQTGWHAQEGMALYEMIGLVLNRLLSPEQQTYAAAEQAARMALAGAPVVRSHGDRA